MYPSNIIDLEEEHEQIITPYSIKHVRQLKLELASAKKIIASLQLDVVILKGTIQRLKIKHKKQK